MKIAENLRQMLALLEGERQALAGLDLERIITCADGKQRLCADLDADLEAAEVLKLDEECEGLLNAVRRLNDINRRLRNMIADNVSARLGALTGTNWLYGRPMEGLEVLPR
jgi:hypothetical protein